jgi:hypothetical protein
MDDDVKRAMVKFIESTGRWADFDLFSEEDAWEFVKEIVSEYARPNVKLSDGQVIILRNLGVALGMKPGSTLAGYASALVRNFGPLQISEADLKIMTMYFYTQVNGGGAFETARRPPVMLQPGAPGNHPYEIRKKKNLK